MVYEREATPREKTVIRDSPESEHRVVLESDGRVAIEHASAKTVHQGLRFESEELDDLVAALEKYRSQFGGECE